MNKVLDEPGCLEFITALVIFFVLAAIGNIAMVYLIVVVLQNLGLLGG